MSRLRTLKPSFFENEDLARFSFAHRLLFQGLWTMADREGRLEDRPSRIKAKIFPYDADTQIDPMLTDLASGADPFIYRYTIGDKRYIAVVKFKLHQHPHVKEADSVLPPPPQALRLKRKAVKKTPNKTVPAPGLHDALPGNDGSSRVVFGFGSGLGELGSGLGDTVSVPEPAAQPMVAQPPHVTRSLTERERVRQKYGPPLADMRAHLDHAWCGDRICVPSRLDGDFLRRMAGSDWQEKRRKLTEFYVETVARIPDTEPIGDDIFDLWRNAFTAKFGTVTQRVQTGKKTAAQTTLETSRKAW